MQDDRRQTSSGPRMGWPAGRFSNVVPGVVGRETNDQPVPADDSLSRDLLQRFRARNRERQKRLADLLAPAAADALISIATWFQEHAEVQGLFSMGSAGTLGHGIDSDFDLWIIVRELASENLRDRATELVRFGRSRGFDIRPFFIDPQRFIQTIAPSPQSDDCGSIQNTLLLDEFYRTAIHWAGAEPRWWNPLPEGFALDFGPADQVPHDEILGATLWHLSKAIDSPQKSLLKLLLLEAYAVEGGRTLCAELQARLQRGGPLDLPTIDPYAQLYERIARYLSGRGDQDRLNWLRLAFYRKTGVHLSTRLTDPSVDWQTRALIELTAQWGWDADYLHWLDRREVNSEAVLQEHLELARQLDFSHQLLRQLADRSEAKTGNQHDVALLQARVSAQALNWPGKIARLNQPLRRHLQPHQLRLQQDLGRWRLSADDGGVLLEEDSSFAALSWLHYNELQPAQLDDLAPAEASEASQQSTTIAAFVANAPVISDDAWSAPPQDVAELWYLTRTLGPRIYRLALNSWGEASVQGYRSLSELKGVSESRSVDLGLPKPVPISVIQADANDHTRSRALQILLAERGRTRVAKTDRQLPAQDRLVIALDEGFLLAELDNLFELKGLEALMTHLGNAPKRTHFHGEHKAFQVFRELQRRWSKLLGPQQDDPFLATAFVAVAAIDRCELLFVDRDGAFGRRQLLERPQPYLHRNLRALLANAARRLGLHINVLGVTDGQFAPLQTSIYLPHPLRVIVRDQDSVSHSDGPPPMDVEWDRALYRNIQIDSGALAALKQAVVALRHAQTQTSQDPYPISVTDVVFSSPQLRTLRDVLKISQQVEALLNSE